ncbi:MAG: segregation ATPase FtsK/SpoIIIE, family, partial [Pseudonocardiales bacterium]|nr:segregation ATPase FtsK/SpoIIIE, family [Pseudonocardiales bacterium]
MLPSTAHTSGMRIRLTLHAARGDADRGGSEIDVELRAPQASCLTEVAPMMRSALGAQLDATISVGGRPLPSSALIGAAELVSGVRLTIGRTGSRDPVLASALQLRVVGGPDAGHVVDLPRGSTTIGRSGGADIVLHDADISRVHAEVRVDYDGIWVRDLDSTNGTAVAGERIGGREAAMPIGDFLNIGSSTLLVVGAAEPPATTRHDPDGLVSVYRASRILRGKAETVIDFPPSTSDQPRPGLALMAVLLPTLLSVGLAAVMHNAQLLAFALLTPITVLSTAASDRWTWRRSSRAEKLKVKIAESGAQTRLLAAVADEVAHRRYQFADPAAIAQAVSSRNCRLWERRRTDPDFLEVGLGLADQPARCHGRRAGTDLTPPVQSALPATFRLTMGPLGLAGPSRLVGGSARWIACQVVALHSPQDVEVQLLVGAAHEAWRWLRWLPSCHRVATGDEEYRELIGELNDEIARRSALLRRDQAGWPGPWTLVIADPSRSFAALPGMASLLENGPAVGITAICVDDNPRALPSACRTIAQYNADSGNRLQIVGAGAPVSGSITADRVSSHFADRLSRGLAPLRDAEADAASRLPDRVRLTDLLKLADYDPQVLLDKWAAATAPCVPIGVTASGPLSIDLIADGPHVLIAGSTGSGKSELLRSLVTGLAANLPPDALSFVLIDYKGGAAFAACADLPHTAAVVTDLDHHLTKRALISLDAELR